MNNLQTSHVISWESLSEDYECALCALHHFTQSFRTLSRLLCVVFNALMTLMHPWWLWSPQHDIGWAGADPALMSQTKKACIDGDREQKSRKCSVTALESSLSGPNAVRHVSETNFFKSWSANTVLTLRVSMAIHQGRAGKKLTLSWFAAVEKGFISPEQSFSVASGSTDESNGPKSDWSCNWLHENGSTYAGMTDY